MSGRAQHRPRTIVLGTDLTDASQNALLRALHLAEQHRAAIHVVHATPRLPRLLSRQLGVTDDRKQREALDRIVKQVRRAGVPAHAHVAQGDPIQVLAAKARAVAADLVVVGARGRAIPDSMIGSTAERLIALDRHRVLLVRRPGNRTYGEVLIAANDESRLEDQLAAARLMSEESPSVLHVYEGAFESTLRLHDVGTAELRRYRESVRREAKEHMTALLERAGLTHAQLVLRHGHPTQVLQRIDPSALLILSRGRSAMRHLLLGSVTRAVIAYGASDVLLV
jgi:nucleotide-binding universal stress UspA family protein